jgi:transcription initiation factor IIE alpha subunit
MDRETVRDGFSEESSGPHGQAANFGNRTPKRKNFIRVNAMAIGKMLGMLMQEASANEISEESGLSVQTVRRYLKELYKNNVIHIADYAEDNRGVRTVKVWAFGDNPDAKKPQRITSKEACAKYRAKMKQIKMMQQMTGQYK